MSVHASAFGHTRKGDAALRSAIVEAAQFYLRLAQSRSPAQKEALIWQNDMIDGADHSESCEAFACLTLESGAQAAGQQSWVTAGTTYPWPVHAWVDSRVDFNPASPGVTSILQDAQAHHRWHPLGDGYTPQPGDWVLFDGHVEVVTSCVGGVLDTIAGDSMPVLSVNAHQYDGSLAAQGVTGFVNNGDLTSATSQAPTGHVSPSAAAGGHRGQADPELAAIPGILASPPAAAGAQCAQTGPGLAAIPGIAVAEATASASRTLVGPAVPHQRVAALSPGGNGRRPGRYALREPGRASAGSQRRGEADEYGVGSVASMEAPRPFEPAVHQQASMPSPAPFSQAPRTASGGQPRSQATPGVAYCRDHPAPAATWIPQASARLAFINKVAPGAIAAQSRYGVPAAVTIAQAIDDSGWGQNEVAINGNNLFGIRGVGPAGSVLLPVQEYENGRWVTTTIPFRAYRNVAESIDDHGMLMATSGYYWNAMADCNSPDTFANDLTGVYATDPNYGANLITLMRQYNLYRYDIFISPAACYAATHEGVNPEKSTGQYEQSGPRQARRGQRHTLDKTQSRPQPAQPSAEDWKQFVLTIIGIPIAVNLFSSAVYELLRKPSRHEKLAKFKFRVAGYGGSIVEVLLPDDGKASREVIEMFCRLAGPGKLYKRDDGKGDWKLLVVVRAVK